MKIKSHRSLFIFILLSYAFINYSCAGRTILQDEPDIQEDIPAVEKESPEIVKERLEYVEKSPVIEEEIPQSAPQPAPQSIEEILTTAEEIPDVQEEAPDALEDIPLPSGNPTTHIIEIGNGMTTFKPELLVIKAGDSVKWINNDLTLDSHPFQSQPGTDPYDKDKDEIELVSLYGGQTYEHTFNKIGEYPYLCFVHKSMSGKIVVVRPGQSIKEMKKELALLTAKKKKKKKSGRAKEKLLAKEMVLIKGGKFVMGSPEEPTEGPVQLIDLPDFYIDKYEVTNEEYEEFADAEGYESEGDWKIVYATGKEKYPVVNVSYKDALAYAVWAGKRLPTEAEWEKAARGTDKRLWPWGDEGDNEMTNVFGPDDYTNTAPVGLFEEDVSPYGVYDMAGNVSEWTTDKYLPYQGSSAPNYPNFSPEKQAIRGGSFSVVEIEQARTHSRTGNKPVNPSVSVGFRLVRD